MTSLDEMIQRNYDDLVRIGACITRSPSRARDLISETYLHLESRRVRVPKTDSDFKRWFYRSLWYVSRARSLNYYKMYCPTEPLTAEVLDEQDEPDERIEQVQKFKSTLTGIEAILFELIFVHEKSYQEIADLYKKYGEMNIRSLQYISKPLKQKIKQTWKH